jgi:hypothetical protein
LRGSGGVFGSDCRLVRQVWDEKLKTWNTVIMGVFLEGPVHTCPVKLKGETRLRYVPWNDYYRNFYTSEIEVCGDDVRRGRSCAAVARDVRSGLVRWVRSPAAHQYERVPPC